MAWVCFCDPLENKWVQQYCFGVILITIYDDYPVFSEGGTFSKIFGMVWGRREYRILIVGLDGAGKTTILYRLQVRKRPAITGFTCILNRRVILQQLFQVKNVFKNWLFIILLAIGFNVETVTIKNIKFQGRNLWNLTDFITFLVWDLGGNLMKHLNNIYFDIIIYTFLFREKTGQTSIRYNILVKYVQSY